MSLPMESAPTLDQHSDNRSGPITALAAELAREINSPNQSTLETALLHVATSIDEAVQGLDDDRRSYPEFLDAFLATAEGAVAQAVSAAQRLLQRHASAGLQVPSRLGVCPAVVLRALSLLMREQTTFAEVEKITECDPILATSLLSQANSALYHRAAPVTSVGAAVAYLGVDASKKVILAASSRPLFASVALRGLWEHSVDIATIAEQLAASAGGVDPSEAFVAGLVHDLGCLVLDSNEQESLVAAHRRLAHGCCRPILADIVLTGSDHGQIGANVLTAWSLPQDIVEAVRYHHRPEAVAALLPSIIYLAEFVSNSEEAAPCPRRLDYAAKMTGVKNLSCVSSDLRRLSTALSMVG